MLIVSLVIARIIAESGAPMPALTDDAVLMIKRSNVVVGDGCNGSGRDAGVGDGGVDAPDDGGVMVDAGTDAGSIDAPGDAPGDAVDAAPPDAGCTSIPGDAITLVVQPRFMTDPQGMKFALLFVTPKRPIVETKSTYLFEELASVTAPEIEVRKRYVQDPTLGTECGSTVEGCGGGGGGCTMSPSETWVPPGIGDGGLGDGGLVVETIGPYEVLRAEPTDANELAMWLTGLGYQHDQADIDAVAPYIALDYTVIAVRVAVGQPTTTTFTPIALTWPGSELRLPAAFGTASPNVATIVYVAAEGRFDLPGANVPFAKRTSWGDAGFLTRNEVVLDSDMPDEDPVAVRDLTDRIEHETVVREEIVHIPVDDCGMEEEREDGGCCRDCNSKRGIRADMIAVVVACGFVLRRRRRRRE